MGAKAKKQSQADKDFIAKIATIGINTGATPVQKMQCKDCGNEYEVAEIGEMAGQVDGKHVKAKVMGYRPTGRRNRPAAPDEQSFSA